jgi:hypothetical protein
MSDQADLEALVAHLVRSSGLESARAARLVGDVLAYLDEVPEAFVRRRHRALQAAGVANPESFQRIADELAGWRFRAPALSARQIRRIIYG